MIRRAARRAPRAAAATSGVPTGLVPPALAGFTVLVLPTAALMIRTPWSALLTIYAHQHVWTALRVSVQAALQATAFSLLLGVPLALLLARVRAPGIGLARALVTVPLVLPPVVGGVALFGAIGRNGIAGHPLHALIGHDLPFTFPAIVLAQIFVSMPFLVVTVEGAFRLADQRLEQAAATLGASRGRIFCTLTLPLIAPAVLAGAVLCFARALGEFGATLLVGGQLPGVTQTLPTLVLQVFQNDPSQAPALSVPLIAVAVLVLATLRDRWLRPVSA